MRHQISAKDLPDYEGKTIYLHDEESKKDEVINDIRLHKGWIRGINAGCSSMVDIALNYNLKKIFVEV